MNENSGLAALWAWIGDSELAFQIGATWWFPLLESIHVLAIVTLVGVIILADLRILNRTARAYPVTTFVPEFTRWAWWMLPIALLTGLALFVSRPAGYAENPAFQIKLVLLLLAGLNVGLLYRRWRPSMGPAAVTQRTRLAAGLSLVLWIGIIFAGRWIGHIG